MDNPILDNSYEFEIEDSFPSLLYEVLTNPNKTININNLIPESIKFVITPESTKTSMPYFETIHMVLKEQLRGRKPASGEKYSKKKKTSFHR